MNSPLHYTICFIRNGDEMLMLNRNKPANMGLWNGVGGKLETGESPRQGVLREVQEETGLTLSDIRFSGIVTWRGDDLAQGGMYAFIGDVAHKEAGPRIQETREGVLMWKSLSWILDKDNMGVAEHVSRFLTRMIDDPICYEHRCRFDRNRLVDYRALPLPSESVAQLSQVKTSSGSANSRP